MASGDFNKLVLRKIVSYNLTGDHVSPGYVFTVSSNGNQNWTPDISVNTMFYSTMEGSTLTVPVLTTSSLNTTLRLFSTQSGCTLTASTIGSSTISISLLFYDIDFIS